MTKSESRKNIRVPFRTTASLGFADREYEERETANLSLTGVFVLGVEGPQPGDRCVMELHRSGRGSDLVLRLQAEVIRVTTEGAALRFLQMDADCYQYLQTMMLYHTRDPLRAALEFTESFPPRDLPPWLK